MKSTKRHFTLENGEYLLTPRHPDARYYKVFFKGKELKDVMGIIRIHFERSD